MSGRNPPSYCTLTLIAMQGHQQKGRQNSTSSNNKDKSNTIIETSTAEDHDDENLHFSSIGSYEDGFGKTSTVSRVLIPSKGIRQDFPLEGFSFQILQSF